MSIPASVEQWLHQHQIAYAVEPTDGPLALHVNVRSTVLHDGAERVLVLTPADCLLDLAAASHYSGRHWQPLAPEAVTALCLQHGTQHLPALPGTFQLPTMVDRRLLSVADLHVGSGSDDLLRLTADQFNRSLADAAIGDFTVPLAELQSTRMDEVADVAAINRAIATFTQLRIRQRLEETLEIAPLPATAERIIRLRSDPYADTRQLTEIVEMDPGLAAQIVGWAASPYYGAPGRVNAVHDAIARVLGFEMVMNLALGLSLGRTVALPNDWPAGFTAYWRQAIFTATAIEALIGVLPASHRPLVGLGYLTGLLHNFGLLILAELFPPQFSTCCRFQEANPAVGYAPIERHLLGLTRDQLAGWLLRLWSLPDEVVTGIRHQADPDYSGPCFPYANLTLVAKRLLRLHEIGDGPLESVPAALYERLHLDPARAMQAIQHVVDASDDLKQLAAGLG